MKLSALFPFLAWTRFVSRQSVKDDFLAGLTGAVIVLPQGVAFAAIAGLPPEYGLYTAMVTPISAGAKASSAKATIAPVNAAPRPCPIRSGRMPHPTSRTPSG